MRLFKFNNKIFNIDIGQWGLPFTIDINRFYSTKFDEKDNLIFGEKVSSIMFRFSILCFHIEFWLEFEND